MDTQNSEFEAASAATTYEVNVLERCLQDYQLDSQREITENLMELCFQTFDRVLPRLGIYRELFAALRGDLYKGVYSDRYTTQSHHPSGDNVLLGNVPYFTLVRRIVDEKDDELAKLVQQLEEVKAKLGTRETEMQSLRINLRESEGQMSKEQDKNNELRKQLKVKTKEIEALNSKLVKLLERTDREKMKLNEEIKDLKEEITCLGEEKLELKKYKNGWLQMDDCFTELRLMDSIHDNTLNSKERRAENEHVSYSEAITNMKTLELQLLDIRNKLIRDYDEFLENRNVGTGYTHTPVKYDRAENELDDAQLERDTSQFNFVRQQFLTNIKDIEEELLQLSDQKERLQHELGNIQKSSSNNRNLKSMERNLASSPDSLTSLSVNSIDFVQVMSRNGNDPFVPNERILNKYSFILYTSCNEGKSFYEVNGVQFCISCQAKTLLCSHKINKGSQVFPMPKNCTHVKIVCPVIQAGTHESDELQVLLTGDTIESRIHQSQFPFLWHDYKRRSGINHRHPIDLLEKDLLSLVRQFLAILVWQDEYEIEGTSIPILDLFYRFLESRYLTDTVTFFVAYNLIKGLDQWQGSNRLIRLFGNCLAGEFDMTCLRYVMLIGDYIDKLHFFTPENIVPFFEILYPSLSDDELEYFKMEYVSFSENQVSKVLLFQYILSIILAHKEPGLHEIEVEFRKSAVRYPGYFLDVELSEAVDGIAPLASEILRAHFYSQSQHNSFDGEVAISLRSAIHIAGYLRALQLSPKLREDVGKLSRTLQDEQRQRSQSERRAQLSRDLLQEEDGISGVIKYASVKALGAKLARNFRIKKMFKSSS